MLDEMGVEATGGKALATSEEFIKGLELYQPADEVGSTESPECVVRLVGMPCEDFSFSTPSQQV